MIFWFCIVIRPREKGKYFKNLMNTKMILQCVTTMKILAVLICII